MITVQMRRELDGLPPKNYLYTEGVASYTENHWVYVIDEDGLVLGCHPEVNVSAVLTKAGENDNDK